VVQGVSIFAGTRARSFGSSRLFFQANFGGHMNAQPAGGVHGSHIYER
jgi:hypothetical protein